MGPSLPGRRIKVRSVPQAGVGGGGRTLACAQLVDGRTKRVCALECARPPVAGDDEPDIMGFQILQRFQLRKVEGRGGKDGVWAPHGT